MSDIDHWYGGDVLASLIGDLDVVEGSTLTQQRIVRRVLTNPAEGEFQADYLWHPDYGCGAGKYVGETVNKLQELKTIIQGQVMLEEGVAQSPIPTVDLENNGSVLYIRIRYYDMNLGSMQTVEFTT